MRPLNDSVRGRESDVERWWNWHAAAAIVDEHGATDGNRRAEERVRGVTPSGVDLVGIIFVKACADPEEHVSVELLRTCAGNGEPITLSAREMLIAVGIKFLIGMVSD